MEDAVEVLCISGIKYVIITFFPHEQSNIKIFVQLFPTEPTIQ
jgi:hypothetical protein